MLTATRPAQFSGWLCWPAAPLSSRAHCVRKCTQTNTCDSRVFMGMHGGPVPTLFGILAAAWGCWGGGLMLAPLPPISCWAPTGRWLRFPEASSLSPATKIITLEECCCLQRAAVNHPAKYDLPVCANNGSCRQTTGWEHFKSQTRGTRPLVLVTAVILRAPPMSKVQATSVFCSVFQQWTQPFVTSQGLSTDTFQCSSVTQSSSWSAWDCTLPTVKDWEVPYYRHSNITG